MNKLQYYYSIFQQSENKANQIECDVKRTSKLDDVIWLVEIYADWLKLYARAMANVC